MADRNVYPHLLKNVEMTPCGALRATNVPHHCTISSTLFVQLPATRTVSLFLIPHGSFSLLDELCNPLSFLSLENETYLGNNACVVLSDSGRQRAWIQFRLRQKPESLDGFDESDILSMTSDTMQAYIPIGEKTAGRLGGILIKRVDETKKMRIEWRSKGEGRAAGYQRPEFRR